MAGLVCIVDRAVLENKKQLVAVGMDLDGNLTDLHRPEIYQLMWENTIQFLPPHLKRRLSGFPCEQLMQLGDFKVGWFLDMRLGYTIITDQDGSILSVKKGTERLRREKILETYPTGVIDTSQSLNPDHQKPRFLPYCDGFDLMEGIMKGAVGAMKGYPTERTVRELDAAWYQAHHSPDGFKRELMRNPAKYGIVLNKELIAFLEDLHRMYRTFVLTNSLPGYSTRMLEALGVIDFFDEIMPEAKKPACFSPQRSENVALMQRLATIGVTEPRQVLYVGDHLYKDVALPFQAGMSTGLRMRRDEVNLVMRKLRKYAGIEFRQEGGMVVPANSPDPTSLSELNTILSQIYRHAQILTTKVQNLRPVLLY